MGKASAETLREIEQTRERLDAEVGEFQRRLPAPAVWAKRAAGLAVGGGAGGTLFWFAVRRARGRKRAKRGDKPQVQAVVKVLPEEWATNVTKALEGAEWRQWGAMALGAWVLVRLAELRQLRRMNRTLLSASRPWPVTA